jgi:hypothetical protein
MALLTRDSPIQERSAANLSCPPEHLFLFFEILTEGRRCVAAETRLAESGTDKVYDDSCARYRD